MLTEAMEMKMRRYLLFYELTRKKRLRSSRGMTIVQLTKPVRKFCEGIVDWTSGLRRDEDE